MQRAERRVETQGRWLWALTRRKGTHVAAVALANKNARVIWALLAHDDVYRQPASVQAGGEPVFTRRDEPYHRRIHTEECSAEHP